MVRVIVRLVTRLIYGREAHEVPVPRRLQADLIYTADARIPRIQLAAKLRSIRHRRRVVRKPKRLIFP